ncbi:MAG: hypothetical protein FWE49_05225 [Synergistaceae bacterium]|nr:hypothetical protein [Synergistaceae bacterium]
MSAELRKVNLRIGKGSYTLQTVLEDDEIDSLTRTISEITEKLDERVPQEEQLAVICMTLGWRLEKISRRLRLLIESMEKMR